MDDCGWAGADEGSGAAVFVHEAADAGHLAVRAGGVRARQPHHVPGEPLQPLRVAQPVPVHHRPVRRPQPVHHRKQLLVHRRNAHAAGLRPQPKGTNTHPPTWRLGYSPSITTHSKSM